MNISIQLLSKFRELDSRGWESPSGFDQDDYESAMKSIKLLKPKVEKIISHSMLLDTSIQDAFFFAELAWLDSKHYTSGVGGAWIPNIAVRFSNFGSMATVYSGNNDEKRLMRFESRIAALLTNHGFYFVPHAALLEAYPGSALRRERVWKDRNCQGWTWFTRFFDYL